MIDVKNLEKTFGDHKVLAGINEHIYPGEKVVVIGPSGSGKSTFLRCLNLLEEPTAGTITVDGEDITDPKTDIDKVRQKMGMVFQQFNLFPHLTIKENIKLAPVTLKLMSDSEAEQKAMELLERVGLPDKAEAYPKQLSGGQQQRVCVARVLATSPKIILLDEPTSALDPISAGKIEETLYGLKDRYTMLLVTRSMQQASRISDKTAFFLDGDLIEYNDTNEMFLNPAKKETEDYVSGKFG